MKRKNKKLNSIKRYSNWIKIILINVIIIIFSLVLVDKFIPYLTNQKPGIENRFINLREHNPKASYSIKSNKIGVNKDINIKTDINGFIIGDSKNNTNSYEYIFLGGSTTECFYVDEKKRFPFKSIQLLNQLANKDFYGYNSGHGGNNMMHSYIILISKIIKLKPKNLVLMNAANDFSYLRLHGNYYDGPRGIINNNEGSLYYFFKTIKDFLFPNLYKALRSYYFINGLGAIPGGPDDSKTSLFSEDNDPLDEYSKLLDLFVETCKIYNIRLILMTQFNNLKNINDIQYSKYNLFNEQIRIVSNSKNIPLIDLDSIVPKNDDMMYDGLHLSDNGSLFVSEIISKYLFKLYNDERDFSISVD
jgi:hypothetical protein